jgi:hypothetical protein
MWGWVVLVAGIVTLIIVFVAWLYLKLGEAVRLVILGKHSG